MARVEKRREWRQFRGSILRQAMQKRSSGKEIGRLMFDKGKVKKQRILSPKNDAGIISS